MAQPGQYMRRQDNQPPAATSHWGWRYHHTGIPTNQPREGECHLEQLGLHVSGFPESPYGIEWMRFEPGSPIHELIRTVPHVAFEVDDLEEALEGKHLLSPPSVPSEGVRVAMIVDNGCPIELIEFMDNGVELGPSPIEGLGVFARRALKAGQRIRKVNTIREITPEAPLREDLGERVDHCDYSNERVVLWGPPDRHVNHSCDPNAYIVYEKGRCYLTARREISLGEEITCDYNMNTTGGTAWPCNCGSRRCRGTVIGDFFRLPPEIQREYRPFLADWFVRRHGL